MMIIRSFEKADFPELKEIYQQGIDTGNATFQTSTKNWPEWNAPYLLNAVWSQLKTVS